MENIIARPVYLNQLISFKDKELIKVITGVRRCGKSVLMEIFKEYLKNNNVSDEQIIAINLEDYDYAFLNDPNELHNYIKSKLIDNKMNYVFIDEVQNCKDFPKVIDSLYIKKNVDIYITGSNAYILSNEIATLLSGRYIEIKMLPLSFKEYVDASGNRDNLAMKYTHYLEKSSFPYALAFEDNKNEIRSYLEGLYNTIVIKDVSSRLNIHDTMILESIIRFLFDNIGNKLSTKKIADTLTSNGRKIDVRTVEKYIKGLLDSFIIYQAKRYNIKGKQYLKTLEKYYVVDIGMRYYLLGTSSTDVGYILENVVYLELLRRGYEVYIGKVDDLEVDFVVKDTNRTIYIQVSDTVRGTETLKRELKPLAMINDYYPKVILTLDEDPEADYNGIRRINALEWLIGNINI